MSVAIITGSCGLVGSESASYFASQGMEVIGIDNDMRAQFFGTSTKWMRDRLKQIKGYTHITMDIRDARGLDGVFHRYRNEISLVIHAAAQPSHDLASTLPTTDFSINASATSVLLEATRRFSPQAAFIFLSTNKVYGTHPNFLPLIECDRRWEISASHEYFAGIKESMSIDATTHSLFGASKVAADVLVQEYGNYFGMNTACFRCGCLTGPNHSGAELHGFLSYLMKSAVAAKPYTIFGYHGKQVRDNLDSADLVRAFDEFHKAPLRGEVYNMGGGRENSCSVLEAIELCEEITDSKIVTDYRREARRGDHIWWITNTSRFRSHYPNWKPELTLRETLESMYASELEAA